MSAQQYEYRQGKINGGFETDFVSSHHPVVVIATATVDIISVKRNLRLCTVIFAKRLAIYTTGVDNEKLEQSCRFDPI